jgi:histidinol dehydrogenase
VSIRIIEGTPAARAHIAQLRAEEEPILPKRVAAHLRDAFGRDISAPEAVAQIVADVRRDGDAALLDYTLRIDGVRLRRLTAGAGDIEAAYSAAPPHLREALHLAADRIRTFHEREPRRSWLEWDAERGALGQMMRPLERVGVYVPGGTAAYPSSLLMAVIPAQVAGVEEIAVATPPGRQGSGAGAILAAAHVVGVERVILLGGAQAIAALAYGTESVPRVDKVVGAGGLFVTLAKKLVYGDAGIDGLYGPTETLLIADDTATPALVAADLLAQAEHDPLATALLVTPSARLAEAVRAEVADQIPSLTRRAIIEEALATRGAILVVADLDKALALANDYAPEHLCLLVADPWSWVGRVRNAGGIFVGEGSSEALGDYVVGPSHIMPTRGTARFSSPLHVRDFVKVTSIFAVGSATARRLAPAAGAIAQAEGLTAHAAAVAARESHIPNPLHSGGADPVQEGGAGPHALPIVRAAASEGKVRDGGRSIGNSRESSVENQE